MSWKYLQSISDWNWIRPVLSAYDSEYNYAVFSCDETMLHVINYDFLCIYKIRVEGPYHSIETPIMYCLCYGITWNAIRNFNYMYQSEYWICFCQTSQRSVSCETYIAWSILHQLIVPRRVQNKTKPKSTFNPLIC